MKIALYKFAASEVPFIVTLKPKLFGTLSLLANMLGKIKKMDVFLPSLIKMICESLCYLKSLCISSNACTASPGLKVDDLSFLRICVIFSNIFFISRVPLQKLMFH